MRQRDQAEQSVRVGDRRTRQREVILELIRRSERPLRVSEILELAQKELPALGIATVYRTVKILQESGYLKTVNLPGGDTCFEREDLEHHHHFQCNFCGRVYDLPNCPVKLNLSALTKQGFIPEEHELIIYGRCPECSQTPVVV